MTQDIQHGSGTAPAGIGAGCWRVGHKVRVEARGHRLHGFSGSIVGPSEHAGFVAVCGTTGEKLDLSVHSLWPALGYSWPDFKTFVQAERPLQSDATEP
jgi:hypothetical protein